MWLKAAAVLLIISLLYLCMFVIEQRLSPDDLTLIESSEVTTVSFCSLIKAPDNYQAKKVRTEAIYYVDMENASLYDPSCQSEDMPVWTVFEPSYQKVHTADEAVKELLRPGNPVTSLNNASLIRRISVTFVGEINAEPNQGHLGSYNLTFRVEKIESAHPVSRDIPWPWDIEKVKLEARHN